MNTVWYVMSLLCGALTFLTIAATATEKVGTANYFAGWAVAGAVTAATLCYVAMAAKG